MGLIIAGILLCVLLCWLAIAVDESMVFVLGILSAVAGIVVGIFCPISGYKEPELVSSTELVSLRDDTISTGTGKIFYVSITGTNSYTYYVEVDSPYASGSQKAYESRTISGSNVTIVEDESYTEAKLVKYVKHGKMSFWTVALFAESYEYVFYVPKGTIVRDASLN